MYSFKNIKSHLVPNCSNPQGKFFSHPGEINDEVGFDSFKKDQGWQHWCLLRFRIRLDSDRKNQTRKERSGSIWKDPDLELKRLYLDVKN